jgi:DNA polymerase III delta prime subunit
MIDVWTEKHRPDTLGEVVGQKNIVDRLEAFVEKDEVPHMLFAGPAGTGKCLSGETSVITSEGNLKPIKELVEERLDSEGFKEVDDLDVMSVDESGDIVSASVSKVFKEEAEEIIEIEAVNGFNHGVTPEHPVLALRGGLPHWVKAENVGEDDLIGVPTELEVGGKKKSFVDELDGDKFHAKLPENIDVPASEMFVGNKKKIIKAIENGAETREEISEETSITRTKLSSYLNNMKCIEKRGQGSKLGIDNQDNYASLTYCREQEIDPSKFKSLKYVDRFNNESKSIKPVTKVSTELVELTGYLLAEGSFSGSRLRFYNKNEKLLERFSNLSEQVFGLEPVRKHNKGVTFLTFEEGGTIGKLFSQVFNFRFEEKKKSHNIELSEYIASSTEECLRRFLRSYSDSEAYVSKQGVEITTASEEMASSLTYLLKRLGIHSRIMQKEKSATNGKDIKREYHTVLVSGSRNLNTFSKEVGFLIEDKKKDLNTLCERKEIPNHDVIDNNPENYREIMEELAIKQEKVFEGKKWMLEKQTDSVGRIKAQRQISELVKQSREKISELMAFKTQLKSFEEDLEIYREFDQKYEKIKEEIKDLETRNKIQEESGIRNDRTLEYSKGKRIADTGRIKTILEAKETERSQTIKALEKLPELQQMICEVVEKSRISYGEIGRELNESSSNIQNSLEGDINPSTVSRIPKIHKVVIEDLNRVLNDVGLIQKLEKLSFMGEADLRWTKVESVEVKQSQRVYDLTVPKTKNFVAGDSPTIAHNTTSAIALAKDLYGDEWKQNFMETNASDERGIDVVREKVKNFARTKSIGADYKIIFLDEADALTSDAQQALRRTMEQFSDNCRFILSCNYSSKIIDPIQSRCAVFRFNRLEESNVKNYIKRLGEDEGFKISEEAVEAVMRVAEGDLRRVTNILQTASINNNEIKEEDIYGISASLRPDEIVEILNDSLKGNFMDARDTLADLMIDRGLDGQDVIDSIHREIFDLEISERAKLEIIENLGEFEFRISEGGSADIQIEAFLAKMADLENN